MDLLDKGEVAQAADELEQYLHDSELELLAAYRGGGVGGRPRHVTPIDGASR